MITLLKNDSKAASHIRIICSFLERKGTTLGVNDLRIAGHARSEGLTLVTSNLREFGTLMAKRYAWIIGSDKKNNYLSPLIIL